MSSQYSIFDEGVQASPEVAEFLSHALTAFVRPLLSRLTIRLDVRLVQTFVATLHVLLQFRHRNNGLPLSELGGYLATPEHAQQGRNGSRTYCILPSGPLGRSSRSCGSKLMLA